MRRTGLGLVAVAALFLTRCETEPLHGAYRGDGRFVDRGPRAAIRRYVLDLGAVDLAAAGEREFAMSGLPAAEFTLGLDVRSLAEPDAPILETRPLSAVVRLEVHDQRGQLLVSAEMALSDWTWSGQMSDKTRSFVYLRGDHGTPVSSFTAQPADHYRVRLTVVQPDPGAARYAVTTQMFAGGWKVQQAG